MESAWMAKGFLPYSLDQHLLLPPDMRKWLAEGHLALFVSDVVDALDLSKVLASCTKKRYPWPRGVPPADDGQVACVWVLHRGDVVAQN